ncbi:MAG: hypothetical protein KBI47_12360 [Armatimonadetes bacterium]|nr:hypothetical protein [Armatimonadota bacterium]
MLVYRWAADLSYDEADRLDSRARAFIACAVYDAARAARLPCQPGPPHGRRPAWMFRGVRVPVSLIDAGFDTEQKTCYMCLGPSIMTLEPSGVALYAQQLVKGFRARFSEIVV